ncbi:MAG: alpha-amylase family glycosyl hydrolase [Acidobacteriota bacterium]|nr:alpha-amylase family glycosyl hydrolase [Blastocatellia bacterium]MDW8239364.1 alpha-amylase family glycosyl hydrolase [Acidobacteriota bacterium]
MQISRAGASALYHSQAAGAPEVLKVEPPNWWVGHSLNPVRVMIRGRNLTGARVDVSGSGVQVGLVRVNAAGTYVFVDLRIDPQATPGSRQIKITTESGSATASFSLLVPLPRQGRFQGFSPDDVIYLIMPDRFCNGDPSNDDPAISRGLLNRQKSRYYHGGDLQGIINRLPYLKQLGVTAIWLNPIYDNVNHLNERETYNNEAITDYHGYGAVDFYAVDEHFGDVAKFRQLVEAAHRHGLKIIQDQVANHTGPYHPWVNDPPTPTWYNGTEANHLANTWQVWTLMDPYATPASQRETLDGWFINILPDLNQNDEEVARYIIQNSLWWLGISGVDGIRQDTLPYVPRWFWRQWMTAIKREYPTVTVVGELFDGDPALVSFFQGGQPRFDGIDTRIDALFDFPLHFPLRRAFAQGKPIREVAMMLARDHLYVNPNLLVTFLGLHDVPRFMNEPGATIEGLKLAFTFLMTTRGIPLIYYGDEIAMPGGGDPDNRRDFPGGWPDDPRNAFEASGRTADQQAVFEHVRKLTMLRAELEPLRRGQLAHLVVTEQTYAYARLTRTESVVVAFNNDTKPATIEIPAAAARLDDGTVLKDRLNAVPDSRVDGGKLKVTLPPRAAALLVKSSVGSTPR